MALAAYSNHAIKNNIKYNPILVKSKAPDSFKSIFPQRLLNLSQERSIEAIRQDLTDFFLLKDYQ